MKNNEGLSFKDLLGIFVPKIWLIVVVALIFAAVVGSYSTFFKDDTYTSEAQMIVTKESDSISGSDLDVAARMIETCSRIVTNQSFLEGVIESIKEHEEYGQYSWVASLTPSYIKSAMTISQLGETELFAISVTTTDQVKSFVLADMISKEINDSLYQYLPYENITTKISEHARISRVANSKNVVRNTVIAFAAGAVVTMVVLFVLAILDVVVRDRKKLEDNFDIPILGVIPKHEIEEEA